MLRHPNLGRIKGGTLEWMFRHPNGIGRAVSVMRHSQEKVLWGQALKDALELHFLGGKQLVFEVFADWLPNPDCRVTLDPTVKDRFGLPVARVRVGKHPRNKVVADALTAVGRDLLHAMGATDVTTSSRGAPSTNLVGGTCRAGLDPKRSVLDRDCRSHDVDNLFVTDGSFMPTGGSVPFTFTIYANAFRVARAIVAQLGG